MQLHKDFELPKELFKRIFISIRVGYRESLKEEDEFINYLPLKLKEELLSFIFKILVKDI